MAGFDFFWKDIDNVSLSCKFQSKVLLNWKMAAFFRFSFECVSTKIEITSLLHKICAPNLNMICKTDKKFIVAKFQSHEVLGGTAMNGKTRNMQNLPPTHWF